MAKVYGKCGAVLATLEIARSLGLEVSDEDVRRLADVRNDAARELAAAQADARQRIESEKNHLAAMQRTLEAHQADFMAIGTSALSSTKTVLERRMAELRKWGKGIRMILAGPALLRLHWKLARIRVRVSAFGRELVAELHGLQRRHAVLLDRPDAEVNRIARSEAQRLDAIEELRGRPETAGAVAELAVVEELRELPDGYCVINDLNLRADSFLRDAKGVPLQSAQIDHLVVGPTGVFVIETKNWSRDFAASGRGFDPHDQVDRANRLCYVLLKKNGRQSPVRSIIACFGYVPAKNPTSYAKALPVREVRNYITWFKHELIESQVKATTRFFLGRHPRL